MQLSEYLSDVRIQLRDTTAQFWSDPILINCLNKARKRVAQDCRCCRQLSYMVANLYQEAYPFSWFLSYLKQPWDISPYLTPQGITSNQGMQTVAPTNPTMPALPVNLKSQMPPPVAADEIIDIDMVNLEISTTLRYPMLKYLSWPEYNAQMRMLSQFLFWPLVWSKDNYQTLYLFPIPSTAYLISANCIFTPQPLVNLTDNDSLIPEPFRLAVEFYTCYLAKPYERSDQGMIFWLQMYRQELAARQAAVLQYAVPSYWGTDIHASL